MIFNKTRKYFQEKVRIDKKANQSTAYKIQVYNNAKVDELVKRYNEGETVNIKTPPSMLWAELAVINKPEVYKNYNKIINSKYTSNDNIDKIIIKNKANKDLNRIVEAEVERISKNLDYVNQVMQKYEIPQKQYEEFKRKQQNNSIANRQEILKQVAIKNNEILASEGLNIPSNVFTYRNLDLTAETLLRQSQMQSKHEEVNSINQHYINQGKDKVYTGKEWIWTGRGKTTRHRSNHLQKRAVNEPFIIVNDKTLHIDEMMYPSDPAGSFSNAFICYCEVEYLTDYDEYKENLFGLHPTTYKPTTTTTYQSPTFMNAKQLKAQLEQPSPVKISQPIGTNIQDYMNVTVADPVIQAIDDTVDGVESIPHNYEIDGNKVEVIYSNGNYYYNGLMLKEYDPVTKIGKVSKSAVTKHNNNITVDAKPTGEFIDVNDSKLKGMLFEDEGANGQYWLDENEGAYINSDGKWEYNGLVADIKDTGSYGKWSVESIIEHNKQFTDTVTADNIPTPVNEPIDTSKLMEYNGEYAVHKLAVTEINGKYYYKGLEVNPTGDNGVLFELPKVSVMEHNKQFLTNDNVTATNKEFIDTTEIQSSLLEDIGENGQYFLGEDDGAYINENGNWEYKGLEADGVTASGNYGKFNVESIEKHNYEITHKQNDTDTINNIKDTVQSTSNQQISNEVDNNTIIDTATSNKQYIDTSILHADADGDYDIDPSIYPELKADIKVNENGELTYKGLKLHEYSSVEGGYLKPDEIEEHNKQFADTNIDESITVVYNKPAKEQINPNHLEYDSDIDAYVVNEFDGVVKYNGDYYYKGLKIDGYNPATKDGIISKTKIENHNTQAHQTEDNIPDYMLVNQSEKKLIDKDDLLHEYGDKYLVTEVNLKYNASKKRWEHKGLEVKDIQYNDGVWVGYLKGAEIDLHNMEVTGDAGFGDIVETNPFIHGRENKVLVTGTDGTGQKYAVDENSRKWVLDENSKYERIQDELQNKIDMSDEYDAVEDWGGTGYRKINHFNYLKKTYEDAKYKKLHDKIIPVLNDIRSAYDKGKPTDKLEEKLDNIIAEAKQSGEFREYDSVFDIIEKIKDIDRAMAKAPPLQQDTCFIRAGAWNLDFNKVGEVFEWDGFAGISYKNRPVDLGHESTAYNITILAPKGTRGVRMSDQFDALTNEREWLLPRGQKFRVLEFDEENEKCTIELIVEDF